MSLWPSYEQDLKKFGFEFVLKPASWNEGFSFSTGEWGKDQPPKE